MGTISRSDLAARIDHTLLRPEATRADVERLCGEALDLSVAAVCVSPWLVPAAAGAVQGSGVAVAAVVGFPAGTSTGATKAHEAATAVASGATELDMVANLGAASAGDWDLVAQDVAAVRSAAPRPVLLKVIVESALWSADDLACICAAAVRGGADMVKTSTGYHPAGGATTAAVTAMAQAAGPGIGVKASGGIGSAAAALAMLDAGATRIGMSRTAAVLTELDQPPG